MGRISFLPKFPHFLFWYEVDHTGSGVGPKYTFSLDKIYEKVLKRSNRGFTYGKTARELAPLDSFSSDYVFYLEGPRYNILPKETLWIEFLDANNYAQWRNSIMFLIKTTVEGYNGVRDPLREVHKTKHE